MKVHLRSSSAGDKESAISGSQSPTKHNSSQSSTSVKGFFNSKGSAAKPAIKPVSKALNVNSTSDTDSSPQKKHYAIKFPKRKQSSPQLSQHLKESEASHLSGSISSKESPPTTIYGTKRHNWGEGSFSSLPLVQSEDDITKSVIFVEPSKVRVESGSTVSTSGPLPTNGPVSSGNNSSIADNDDNDANDDANDDASSSSSEYSFQHVGRNASIKYYKSIDEIGDENEQLNQEKFMQFINSSEPLDELDDDVNFDDDEEDDTSRLFSRDLFGGDTKPAPVQVQPKAEVSEPIATQAAEATPQRMLEINQLLSQLQGTTLNETPPKPTETTPKRRIHRVNSIKYHQLDSGIKEDNIEHINRRYGWLREYDDIEYQDEINLLASSSSLEDSLLDEINELPEEFDFDTGGKDVDRSSSVGNKINLNRKTVTLFGPISPEQKNTDIGYRGQTRYSDILGDHEMSPEPGDEFDFVAKVDPRVVTESSFLTTISEASQEDSQSYP